LNAGAYRAQVHDKEDCGMVMAAGHHGRIHRDRPSSAASRWSSPFWGGDPLAFFFGGLRPRTECSS
jgi:4-hydroxy-3-polyprenylbenzoate decarboxylase